MRSSPARWTRSSRRSVRIASCQRKCSLQDEAGNMSKQSVVCRLNSGSGVIRMGPLTACHPRAPPARERCRFLRNRCPASSLQPAYTAPILPVEEREASTQARVSHSRGLSSRTGLSSPWTNYRLGVGGILPHGLKRIRAQSFIVSKAELSGSTRARELPERSRSIGKITL